MRILSMKKVREVLRLHIMTQLSIRKIQSGTGIPRSTMQDYAVRFKSSGLSANDIGTLDDNASQTIP